MGTADDDEGPLGLTGQPVGDGVERAVHVLDHGQTLVCDASWRGALAVVEQGSIGLEAPHGGRLTLVEGDAFCVELTGPVLVRSTGSSPAVLATVRRRPTPPRPAGGDMTDGAGPRTAARFTALLLALADHDRPAAAPAGFRVADADDQFVGVRMREVFALAKQFTDLGLDEVEALLESPVHEVRVGAVSVMDFAARRKSTPPERREALYGLYLRRHDRIDNWDLVDRAAPSVVGGYLFPRSRDPLYELARSPDPMRRRTAITATYHFLQRGQVDDTFGVAELLLDDPHDLVQKAVGGWLRHAGTVDASGLRAFLQAHAPAMSRTTLRYAVEHLAPEERQHFRGLTRATAT